MINKEDLQPNNVKTSRDNNDNNMNTNDRVFSSPNKNYPNDTDGNYKSNLSKAKQMTNTKDKEKDDTVSAMPPSSNALISPRPNQDGLQKDKETSNAYGQFLKSLVFITILIQYLSYVIVIEINSLTVKNAPYVLIRLFIFHFIFILMIASLCSTIRTNPGTIPLYWGFYIGDEDFKKKRYCLLCQVFKPDRTHHCSICNVCVLNMDHHCPWIDSCIGFYNKKYFVQLLFYFLLVVLYLDFAYLPSIYNTCKLLYQLRHGLHYMLYLKSLFLFINYAIALALTGLDLFFFNFHLHLVLNNCTTIESLDEDFIKTKKYNIGLLGNWEQVFGKSKVFWFLPFGNERAFPNGDGLNWPVNALAEGLSMNMSMSMRKNTKEEGGCNDSKSGSTNMTFLKQFSTNYSSNANANAHHVNTNSNTIRSKDRDRNTNVNLDQIIEMNQRNNI